MTVTMCVCTIGRDSLVETIRSIAALNRTPDQLLIIDQSESGAGEAAVQEAGYRHPYCVVEQKRLGIGRGRQTAAETFRTDWLYFTDDDCRVAPDLLHQFELLVRDYPDADFWAGACFLPVKFDESKETAPGLIVTHIEEISPANCFDGVGFMGANMAFSKKFFSTVGYDPEFGAGSKVTTGEETDLVVRGLILGMKGRASGRLVVYHDYGMRPNWTEITMTHVGNIIIDWKMRKMGSVEGQQITRRIRPYRIKNLILHKLTMGKLYPLEGQLYRKAKEALRMVEREYTLENGLLKRKEPRA